MTLNHLSKGPQLKNGENLPSPTIRFSRGWKKRKQSSNIKKGFSLQHGIKTKY